VITHNGRKMHCLQNLCGCWQVAIFQFSVLLIHIYYVFLRACFFQYLACCRIAVSFTRESTSDKEIPIEPKTDKWTSAGQAREEKHLPDVALSLIPSHWPKPHDDWITDSYSELITRISSRLVIFSEV